MRAGTLRDRINFFEKTIVRDDYGASTDTWDFTTPTLAVRGEVRYTGGSKGTINEEKFYSKNIELYVRYQSTIVETMKIQINGTTDIWLISYMEILGNKEGLRLTIEKAADHISLPAIDPPTTFAVALNGTNDMDLTWVNNGSGDATVIQRSEDGNTWELIHTTAAGIQLYADTGLSNDTRYYYRIRHIHLGQPSVYTLVEYDTTTHP